MTDENYLKEHREVFELSCKVDELIDAALSDFNKREVKLFDLPTHQRIFLFILTRALKSYSAIRSLCQEGYGQDTAMLLRNLLDNLITTKYILAEPGRADDLTRRFVAYKWVIFKRSLQESERRLQKASQEEIKKFFERKNLILKNVEDFKKTYNVSSDRALLTWSGKTVRDMAKKVSPELLEEYEHTFRLCSRFSHPSILGDQEYLVQDDQRLMFSSLPSGIGIVPNMKKTLRYILDFLVIVEDLFAFGQTEKIQALYREHDRVFQQLSLSEAVEAKKPPQPSGVIRESIVTFQTEQNSPSNS